MRWFAVREERRRASRAQMSSKKQEGGKIIYRQSDLCMSTEKAPTNGVTDARTAGCQLCRERGSSRFSHILLLVTSLRRQQGSYRHKT